MTILKLFGVLLLLGVGAYSALSLSLLEKRRIAVLNGWLDLIYHIRTQIDCYLTPLDQIFAELPPNLSKIGVNDHPATDLSTLLQCTRPYLDGDSIQLLDGFAREIGTCYREEQVKRCDYFLSALRGIRDRQKAQLPARLRAQSALCLCGAFGLAILLW